MSQQPLVIAYHLIWTAYGCWLPNDPRGSGSRIVRTDVLARLGELHLGRKRVQPAGTIVRQFYETAQAWLKHPFCLFDAGATTAIGEACAAVIVSEKLTCYACAIMPDHVHILLRKHRLQAEEMIDYLKSASRARLLRDECWPADHPVWTAGGGWKVYLDHPDEVRRTIGYIDKNPEEVGLPRQQWPFVRPYDGWPLHPGHSPNSPYAKRLRAVGRYP